MNASLRRRLRTSLRAAERLLAVAGACMLLYHGCLDYAVVISGSMSPGLQGSDASTGDRVVLEKVTGWFRAPKRWEIQVQKNQKAHSHNSALRGVC